ncbi:MAG: extracellular solute-binding protein, partial [Spirochaetales bacterium]|nr:extracellular solute-binding protein [Spirochaetales bacterium]
YKDEYHYLRGKKVWSGEAPDIAFLGPTLRWDRELKEAGLLYEHSEVLNPDLYDFNLLNDMDPEKPGKQIYELPFGTPNLTTVLYMNTALLASLGLDAPEKYEDLVAMVPKARAAGIQVIGIDGADGWAWGSCLLSVILGRLSGETDWIRRTLAGEHSFADPALIQSLRLVSRMVEDGLISRDSVHVDYGTNIENYCNGKSLFMVQGQWSAQAIDVTNPEIADTTRIIGWPVLPGESPATAGFSAASISPGYGLLNTEKMRSDSKARAIAVEFIDYLNRRSVIDQRQKVWAIVAPVLKEYTPPSDIPDIIKSKIEFARSLKGICMVIDDYLEGEPNDALNHGLQQIFTGKKTPEQVAEDVEKLFKIQQHR